MLIVLLEELCPWPGQVMRKRTEIGALSLFSAITPTVLILLIMVFPASFPLLSPCSFTAQFNIEIYSVLPVLVLSNPSLLFSSQNIFLKDIIYSKKSTSILTISQNQNRTKIIIKLLGDILILSYSLILLPLCEVYLWFLLLMS